MTLDDFLKVERTDINQVVRIHKEFDYLYFVNSYYFEHQFTDLSIINFSLDSYNHWKRNGVVNAKQEALVSTVKRMYHIYTGGKD